MRCLKRWLATCQYLPRCFKMRQVYAIICPAAMLSTTASRALRTAGILGASTSMTIRSGCRSSLVTGRPSTGKVKDQEQLLCRNSSSGRRYTKTGSPGCSCNKPCGAGQQARTINCHVWCQLQGHSCCRDPAPHRKAASDFSCLGTATSKQAINPSTEPQLGAVITLPCGGVRLYSPVTSTPSAHLWLLDLLCRGFAAAWPRLIVSPILSLVVRIHTRGHQVALEPKLLALLLAGLLVSGCTLDLLKQELHKRRCQLGRAVDEPFIDQQAGACCVKCLPADMQEARAGRQL